MSMLKWLWLSALIVVLDQASKYLMEALLTPYEPLVVLPLFNLTLMYNTGAAFSFLAGAAGWQRWFFLLLAIVISTGLIVWLARLKPGQHWQGLALALIVGGALGNAIDRAIFGHVIDFIQVYYDRWYFPAFNLADSAISIGAVVLIADGLFGDHRAPSTQTG